jgi:catechol 2,3-dioxygenase-like lactoylglutathione lyase family enzyme
MIVRTRLTRTLAAMVLTPMALVACLAAWPATVVTADTAGESVGPLLTQKSMNVFRRFSADRQKMLAFYGDVLGLTALPSLNMPGGGQMVLYQVGTSQVKLQATPAAKDYASGPVDKVVGLRVMTFFYPDEAAVTARFIQHGYAAPAFKASAANTRRALVADPDGQWVELVVAPGAPAETFDHIEVGLNVSDLERSRAFYRQFVGLEELAPVTDTLLNTRKYPFRNGTTTVNLWTLGSNLPANTRSAGIQYIVSDAGKVDELAKARGVKIDTPLGNFSATLRTIWLGDPDGITNYFAQFVRTAPASR